VISVTLSSVALRYRGIYLKMGFINDYDNTIIRQIAEFH